MNIYTELRERELIAQSTNEEEIEKLLNQGGESIYIGFDATAKSLHIGSLLQLIILKRLQDAGHRPILLIGGGTTMVILQVEAICGKCWLMMKLNKILSALKSSLHGSLI